MEIKQYTDLTQIKEQKLDELQYYIYILENTDKRIKIGITQDIQQRVKSLSNSNTGGSKITRIAVSPPTYLKTIETALHTHYDWYRVEGEWFEGITFQEVCDFLSHTMNTPGYKNANELRKLNGGYGKINYKLFHKKDTKFSYQEENKDIFTVDKEYVYANWISSDCKMDEGIALEFAKRGIRERLLKNGSIKWKNKGYCIPIKTKNHIVCNLVIKKNYYDTATYITINKSLQDMKEYMLLHHYENLAISKIDCDKEELVWKKVADIIKDVFDDTDIKVLVCDKGD